MSNSTSLEAADSSALLATRSLKRRFPTVPDMAIFTPASATFKPRPYLPHASSSVPHRKAPTSPVGSSGAVHPLPPADPTPEDPSALFIHPPFDDFPESHLHPEGLCYNLMAQNPEWFLDPVDFISTVNDNPSAVAYPSVLEPPRGWCGAIKKKDVKDKSLDGWPEGEEPRLRCTFCRRTYAGINAKSMWRRHVFEKHKIAMANRRDGPERGRGGSRVSNKENKQFMRSRNPGEQRSRSQSQRADDPFTSQTTSRPPQKQGLERSFSDTTVLKSKLRSQVPSDPAPFEAPLIPQQDVFDPVYDDQGAMLSSPYSSPCQLPPVLLPPSSPVIIASPAVTKTRTVPQSPYDPTQTPAFKHSEARLPCEQPWRFPSPSHPLHSSPEELCLGVAVGGIMGEGLQSAYVPVMSSPIGPLRSVRSYANLMSSPFTPAKSSPLKRKVVAGRVLGFNKRRNVSDSDVDVMLKGVPKAEPRRLFYSGPLPVPVSDRIDFNPDTSVTDSEAATVETLFPSELEQDPFGAWFNINGSEAKLKDRDPGEGVVETFPDSPVIRSVDLPIPSRNSTTSSLPWERWQRQASGVGLGILVPGKLQSAEQEAVLMCPSASAQELAQMEEDAEEVDGELMHPPSSQEEQEESEESTDDEDSFDLPDLPYSTPPPLKRRRTIDVIS